MKTWTKDQLAILESEYAVADLKELSARIGKGVTAVKSKAGALRLHRSPEARFWNTERISILKKLYSDRTNEEIAQILGSTPSAVSGKAFVLGLSKSKEFLFRCSSKTFFSKGHCPANKGLKQKDYMTEAQIEKTKATRFKRGSRPKNYKPVGYERVNKYGYLEIKIADPDVFELKHRVVWKKVHGDIPPGYNVQFKDGNKLNVSIENLYLINRAQQMKTENSFYARYPEEVQMLIRLKGCLNRQIRTAIKKNANNGR